jgi:hypothetical protein
VKTQVVHLESDPTPVEKSAQAAQLGHQKGDRDTIAWIVCMTFTLSVNKRMTSPCLTRQCSANSCSVNLTVISAQIVLWASSWCSPIHKPWTS